MASKLVDITMHIDQRIQQPDLESLRYRLLKTDGVKAADYQIRRPHLMVVGYDPEKVKSAEFIRIARQKGLTAELVGL